MFLRIIKKITTKVFIFILIFFWIFLGWPEVWKNPRIPPEIPRAQAAHTFDTKTGTVCGEELPILR